MHVLLTAGMLLIIVLFTSRLMLGLLGSVEDWKKRRLFQLPVLFLPITSLFVLMGGLQHVLDPHCIQMESAWDHVLDIATVLFLGGSILGSAMLGLVRLFLMNRTMKRETTIQDSGLETRVAALTAGRGIGPVRVRLVPLSRPLALIYDFHQPTLLLSTWMVEHLDEQEVEAVLIHELVHIQRADYLINWVALMLRDAFFYLPPIRATYRQLKQEKELACDDLVAHITQRPLALASALTKVWLFQVETRSAVLAQTLVAKGEGIESRVERLLSKTPKSCEKPQRFLFLSPMALSVCVLFLVTVISLIGMRALLLCWPTLALL
jgi:beta-lactamase regulating signal transducer with metallopeptidase domain